MAYTKVTGTLVNIGDLDLTNVGQIQLDSIAGDADSNTSITFSGSDVITIATGGSGRLTIGDGALSPVTDNQIDLGTSSLEFKDAFFDGTVTSDAFAGPLTGDVTGNVSGTAATVTGAAQTNITSLGTLTALSVDNITINGNDISSTNSNADITVTPNGSGNVNVYTDSLQVIGAEGESAKLALLADEADDSGDIWSLVSSQDNTLTINTDKSGSSVAQMTLTPHATVASSTTAIAGNLGIGIASPAQKVHVQATASNHTSGVQIYNSQSGGYGSGLTFSTYTSTSGATGEVIAGRIRTEGEAAWNSAANNTASLVFSTIDGNTLSDKMRIRGNGMVGIGCTPSYDLHIQSTADSRPHLLLEGVQNHDTDDAPILEFYTNDSTTGGIADSTYVGEIIFSGDEKDGGTKEIYAKVRGMALDPGSGTGNKGSVELWSQVGGTLQRVLNARQIQSSGATGAVGINEVNPAYTFDINTNGESNALRCYQGTNSKDLSVVLQNAGTGSGDDTLLQLYTAAGAGDPYIRFNISGTDSWAMGINNSENDEFQLSNQSTLGGTSYMKMVGGNLHFSSDDSDCFLYLGSTGGDFGGNSSHNLRCSGNNFMFNSGNSNFIFEINGSQKGYIDANGFNNGSDRNLKKDIEDITYGLDTVKLLQPRKFKWKADDSNSIGLIAQEVETHIPEIVSESAPDNDEITSIKGVNYQALTSVLIKGMQEQQTIIDDLKSRIETLEG